jgi:ethanolamine utilization protein EutP (predicted NTPase)
MNWTTCSVHCLQLMFGSTTSASNAGIGPVGFVACTKRPSVDVAVVTKMDLAEAVEFDAAALARNIHAVRPGMPIFPVSSKSGAGMDEYLAFLEGYSPYVGHRFSGASWHG